MRGPDTPRESPDKLMTFTEHLEELRTRLKYSAIALFLASAVAYLFVDLLFGVLAQPLARAWREAGLGAPRLHFANPTEPFFTYIKLALMAGVFVASPVIFYQLWKFVAPGLTRAERRYVLPFVVASTLCFVGGACFGYFVVFPYGFRFFLGFAKADLGSMQQLLGTDISVTVGKSVALEPTLMISEYFGLVWRLLVAFGVVFELPVLLGFLALVGLVDHRSLWKWNPYFIVIAFFVGGVLTPGPDVVTQVLMAGPLIALYNVSILIAYLLGRSAHRGAES